MPRTPRSDRPPSPAGALLPAGLSQPAIRALTGAGYSRLDQLAGASEAKLRALHGLGQKGITTIKAALAKRRQRLAP